MQMTHIDTDNPIVHLRFWLCDLIYENWILFFIIFIIIGYIALRKKKI